MSWTLRLGWVLALFLTVLAPTAQAQGGAGEAQQLRQAAEAGDAQAQYKLAILLHEGNEVLQDFSEAAKWLQRAADQGLPEAENRLGQMYHSGIGVAKDRAQALIWLSKAAAEGNENFLYDYGLALEHGASGDADLALAAEQYGKAMEKGHVDAAVSLAVLLQSGRGVPQDLAMALSIYQQAANAGHARAQNNLGLIYARGEGVEVDHDLAFRLFKAAADQGLAVAKSNLSTMYGNGFGVDFDDDLSAELAKEAARAGSESGKLHPVYDPRLLPVEADEQTVKQLTTGAKSGDPVAQFQLAWLLVSTSDVAFEQLQQAEALFRASAEAGYAPAMANLAVMYVEGWALPQDYVLAQMWLVLAGASGFTPARDMNFTLATRMTQAQIAMAQTMAKARVSPN
ncbi:sel1 repeat family protein [Tropicibacter sp. R15_0]|uniref:tetratricopeptide repeat protein n=1 Tax=Tropicibacter sp. R15_0 TaxID=2821101 RepID=UPI001ADB11C9|nr:SEL1-like repeat protein [Tropicibacter sp. R15_0]MBO9463905.1 sel1 repeat family protein [Tropicibacter sp. R15_0]